MKLNYQKTIIAGVIGKDADVKTFANGNSVLSLTVATSENWKNKDGEWQEKTTWHNVKLFGKAVDYVAPKAVKGAPVFIEGIINTDEYEKDGVKKYITFIKADSVKVFSDKKESTQSASEKFNSDDIPF